MIYAIAYALLFMALLGLVIGGILAWAKRHYITDDDNNILVEKIEAILPQTQCGQCNFPGCKPYAVALAKGQADINQCPPGGEEGVRKLADLLGCDTKPLAADLAGSASQKDSALNLVAVIDESRCIGCTFCIQSCPVDAILGATKQMHTVLTHLCTGCKLCIAPCPVDCISMEPISSIQGNWKWPYPAITQK